MLRPGTATKWATKIYQHAMEHYNDRGIRWDYVVECWTIEELAAHLEEFPPLTYQDALSIFRDYARNMDEREKATHQ